MATAIIKAVEAGQEDSEELVRATTAWLITAINADPAALGAVKPLPEDISVRVHAVRARVRDERAIIAEMSSRSDRLKLLLGLASIRLNNVERIFLEEGALQENRSPAQWDKWLQAAEDELLHAEEHRKQVQEKIDMPDAFGSSEK